MGAQQTKDRIIPAGSTVRQTRKQPRNLKESRIIGSNIFTEHSDTILYRYCYAMVILNKDWIKALLQSRPLPHIPALPEGDPPSSSNVQPISQQANIQQHTSVSTSGLLEAANRSISNHQLHIFPEIQYLNKRKINLNSSKVYHSKK
ncbi:tyrosine-protein kinase Abl isoform X1 [Vespula maculifrons]|uniref:Tyrosine-protein kinase Abl isoform X1 n=1 Tax=Vespula maculifrons TaxID=7453 RepID=A0ABD2C3X3_VESMC